MSCGRRLTQNRFAVKWLSRHKKGLKGCGLRAAYLILFHDPLDTEKKLWLRGINKARAGALLTPIFYFDTTEVGKMAKKNNIRSIRFSDELAELIDRQIGDTFTEKFENLITKCVWELPAKEKELTEINRMIQTRRNELTNLTSTTNILIKQTETIQSQLRLLQQTIEQTINRIENK